MPKPTPPATRKVVSDFLKLHLGGEVDVRAYYDNDGRHVVAVVEAVGTPRPELTTFMTSSLHASVNRMGERDLRVELTVVAPRGEARGGNLAATAAFFVSKDRWLAAPGVVFPDQVREYWPTASAQHLMWVEPFDFDGLGSFDVPGVDHPIHALQALPITDREYQLLRHEGFEALEQALIAAGIDHFDFDRESAV